MLGGHELPVQSGCWPCTVQVLITCLIMCGFSPGIGSGTYLQAPMKLLIMGCPAYQGLFLTAYHISDSWCHSDLIGRMIVASWMVGKFGQGIVLMEHAGNLPSGMLDIQTEVPWWCWGSCWLLGAATHCTWKKSTSGMGPWSNHRLWKLSKRSAWNLVTILHIVPAGKGGISTESHIPFCRVIRRDGYGAEDPQTHTWHTLICN